MWEVKRPTRDDSREHGRGHTTMERRKFIIGAGALASGSAAAVGTGALSQSNITRDSQVSVATDANGWIQLEQGDPNTTGDNPEYVTEESDGTLALDLSKVNNDAETLIDDVFTLTNNTSDELVVSINKYKNGNERLNDPATVDPFDRVRLYADWSYPPTKAMRVDQNSGQQNIVTLTAGESVEISIEISTGSTAPASPHHLGGGSFGNDLSGPVDLLDEIVILAQDRDDTTDAND